MHSDVPAEVFKPPAPFSLPQGSQPYARELFIGRGVHVYFDQQAPASWPEHKHSEFELLILGEDALCEFHWQETGGAWREEKIRGGQLCVVPPQVAHRYSWRRKAEMILLYIGAIETPVSPNHKVVICEFEQIAGGNVLIWQLLHTLRDLCRQTDIPSPLYVESVAAVLAIRLMRELGTAGRKERVGPGLTPAQLENVVAYIDEHLSEGIPVATLATKASVSRCHFIRLFKQSTGLAPHRFVLNRRLMKAKDLLATQEFRVAEAAYQTGFCDQSHLNRHFKRFFGFTPATLVRRYAQYSTDTSHPHPRDAAEIPV
jgi:AraC family transcriptional regulator